MTFFCIPTLALYFASDQNTHCIVTKSLSVAPRVFVCSYTYLIGVKCQVVAQQLLLVRLEYLLKLYYDIYHDIHSTYHDIVDVLAT